MQVQVVPALSAFIFIQYPEYFSQTNIQMKNYICYWAPPSASVQDHYKPEGESTQNN